MDLLETLVSEKYLLSAVLLFGYMLQHRERVADKKSYFEKQDEWLKRLDKIAEVIEILRDKIK